MPITKYDRPTQFQYRNTLPFEAIAAAGSMRQQQYDTNVAKAGAISDAINKVSALEPDVNRKNNILGEYESKIDKLIEEAGGDYGQISGGITQLNRDFNKELTRGKLASIQSNYASAMKEFEQYNTLYEKNRISATDLEKLKALSLKKYKDQGGIGDNPSETGAYQGYTPVKANFIKDSLAEQANKFIKGWKANQVVGDLIRDDKGFFSRTENKYVSPKEVGQEVIRYLQATPENMLYAQQQAELNMLGRAEDALTISKWETQTAPDGKEVQVRVEVPATAEEFQQNYMNKLFTDPARAAAEKAGFSQISVTDKQDWQAKLNYKQKLEDYIIPLQFTGSDINVSKQITDPINLENEIGTLAQAIASMEADLIEDDGTMTTIEREQYKATLGFSKEKVARYNDLLNRAYKETGIDRSKIAEITAEKPDPKDFGTDRHGAMAYGVAYSQWHAKLEKADSKEYDRLEEWLEKNKASSTIKPEMISTPSNKTKTTFDNHYASNPHAFIVLDASGAPLQEGDYPADLTIGGITKKSIGGQGRYYSASRTKGEKGKETVTAYYVKPIGKNNLDIVYAASLINGTDASAQAIGLDIITNQWDNFTSELQADPGIRKEVWLGNAYYGNVTKEGNKYVHYYTEDGEDKKKLFETDSQGDAKGKLDAYLTSISTAHAKDQ